MMATIEERARARVNEVLVQIGQPPLPMYEPWDTPMFVALCRALKRGDEILDAERAAHAQFRQEVSDAVEEVVSRKASPLKLRRFLLAKPDPLVEVLDTMLRRRTFEPAAEVVADEAAWLRAALAERGLKLVEVGDAD